VTDDEKLNQVILVALNYERDILIKLMNRDGVTDDDVEHLAAINKVIQYNEVARALPSQRAKHQRFSEAALDLIDAVREKQARAKKPPKADDPIAQALVRVDAAIAALDAA
jgi:hypothetical protein